MPKSPYHCRSERLQGHGRSVCARVCVYDGQPHTYLIFISILLIFYFLFYFYLWPGRRLRSCRERATRVITSHRSAVRASCRLAVHVAAVAQGLSALGVGGDFMTRILCVILICGEKITTKWAVSTGRLHLLPLTVACLKNREINNKVCTFWSTTQCY